MNIDIHAHVLTEAATVRMQRESPEHSPRILTPDAPWSMLEMGDLRYQPFPRGGWDLSRRLADMDAARIDVQALSVVPFTFAYHLPPEVGLAFARIQNEEIASIARSHPERFVGLATLPLQTPRAAADELRRSVVDLGLRGAALATNVAGRNLDWPELDPVWAAAQELGAFLFVHPERVAAADRLADYYLINLLGNPLDTSIAIASLVFGGVLERFPRLTLCFAHGGGFIPYQRGRLQHGWQVRPEPRATIRGRPEEALQRLYYDTILHSDAALAYLVGSAGSDHVLLGSDYPFDMGPGDPVGEVTGLAGVSEADQRLILGTTAERLLGLSKQGRGDVTAGASAPGSTGAPPSDAPGSTRAHS